MRVIFCVLVLAFFAPNAAQSQSAITKNSLGFFGGIFAQSYFPGTANIPLAGKIESNFNFGVIYNRDFVELPAGFRLGAEVGASVRFGIGEETAGEVWGGASFSHRGWRWGAVKFEPRFTIGISAVTNTIGIETQRAQAAGGVGNGKVLAYLGPELALAFDQIPHYKFFYRTHHRSGAFGTFANMTEGHNAHVFGIRREF